MISSAILSLLIANLGPILATVATAFGAWAARAFVKFAGAWVEQKDLATLEKALITGLTNGLLQGGATPPSAVATAVEYAKQSTPGAIKNLGATEAILAKKAASMLQSLGPVQRQPN